MPVPSWTDADEAAYRALAERRRSVNWIEAPAGRALDAEIARRVFNAPTREIAPGDWFERRDDRPWEPLPHYSSDVCAAFGIVTHLAQRLHVFVSAGADVQAGGIKYSVTVGEDVDVLCRREWARSWGSDLPLAICRAALAALAAKEA